MQKPTNTMKKKLGLDFSKHMQFTKKEQNIK